MPYEPKLEPMNNREFSMKAMWVFLGLSIAAFLITVFGWKDPLLNLPYGATAGSLMGMVYIRRQDEYFQRLVSFGARWTCVVAGLWLLASMVSFTQDYAGQHVLWLTGMGATFHIAFTYARLRG